MVEIGTGGTRDGDGASLFVAGDCVNDRTAGDGPSVAPALAERVAAADLSLVNLEAPVPTDAPPATKAGPTKSAAAGTPSTLRDAGFDAVTLANNHIMDYGTTGLEQTLADCRAAGLDTCGAGPDRDAAMAPLLTTVDGTSVAVFSFCEQEFGIATATEPGTAPISHPDARRRVSEAAEAADVVVVAAHGGVEYVPLPPPRRQRQLRAFVDAGADAVVGHHPHVPQGWEVYDDAPIFYSLGNFLFEQPRRPKTRWGLAVELALDDEGVVAADLLPTELVDGTARPLAEQRDPTDHLQHLRHVSSLTADRERLRAHWQEIAVRLFLQRYAGWLRSSTGGSPISLLRHPLRHLRQDALWESADRTEEMLVLLNVVRNESHRSTVETALAVRTGDVEDLRTPQVREEVRTLLEWTEDEPVYDRPSPLRSKVRAALSHLASKLPDVRDGAAPDRA